MNELHDHYRLLLGLDDSWQVADVDLVLEENRVEIELKYSGQGLQCPDCGADCSLADHAPERRWRHLDTMQFETRIRARAPRTRCQKCGVKTIPVPWAGKHSRFTLFFEAFAIQVLKSCSSVSRGAALLRLDWGAAHAIMERAVERGLATRSVDQVRHVGVDEKSFRRGHSYVSVLTDIDGSRVLDVAEGRDEEAANRLWKSLPDTQRENVEAVATDMWTPYVTAAQSHAPQADVVHDKFHIAKHLNEAVDQVRRAENKQLLQEGDDSLKGSKQLWLFRESNLPDKHQQRFRQLKNMHLKTSRAWAIKEYFQCFWNYSYAGFAKRFFADWHSWAVRSQLKPMIKKAKMLKRHLEHLLTYFRHFITNAKSEAFNSRIQSIKSAARGFRSFENYRIRILFYCGKLDLLPERIRH